MAHVPCQIASGVQYSGHQAVVWCMEGPPTFRVVPHISHNGIVLHGLQHGKQAQHGQLEQVKLRHSLLLVRDTDISMRCPECVAVARGQS